MARRERKVITVVFADLVGFTSRAEHLDPEDVEAILTPYHARVRDELQRFGGTVEKFIGDAVMAVFGAPVAREDDPERAVRAALAIREWAREDGGVEVRIAVNTGETIVSLDARPESGEAMVAGDVVNTAARMQSAAPVNGILVGETTHNATKHVIDFVARAGIDAKGKAAQVPVWEVLQARSRFGVDVRQHGGAPLVGRKREVDILTSALDRVKQERSIQLLTLVGVPGIGKSRLVWELFGAIERGDELVYWRQGRSLPYGDGVSFWAVSEMVKAHAGILESDGPDTAEEKLARAVSDVVGDGDAQWVASFMRPLLGLSGEAELGGDRRDEAFAAWRRFFEALAEQRPLVLVYEDLHFADDGLLDFVDYLAEWATDVPLLVVCTARPELLERRPGWGGGKLNSTTLGVQPLNDEDSARLVAALLDRKLLPAETQSALLDRAGGNPLYAEQFARLYVERGSLDDLPLPETVHGLIAARLDALPTGEKALLQDAAVVGKVFWAGSLRRPADELRAFLHSLERKEFVRRERRPSVEGEDEYVFRHLLVQDVAYGQIPRLDRAEKHRLTAEWIESLGRPDDHAELLAHHYLAATELLRSAGAGTEALAAPARSALRAAGDRAYSLSAFSSAFRFYDEALGLTGEDDVERLPLELARARVAYYSGRPEAPGLLRAASASLVDAGDRGRAAEAEVLLAEQAWQTRAADRTFEHIERALDLVADAPPSASKAAALSQAARFNMLRGNYETAIDLGRAAHDMAQALGLEEVQAQALHTLGPARFRAGDLGGVEDTEAGIAIARRIRSSELARGMLNLSVELSDLGEMRRAFEVQQEAAAVAERMGQLKTGHSIGGGRGFYLYLFGSWDESLAAIDAFLADVAAKPHYLEGSNRRVRAVIRFARDDVAGALDDSGRAAEIARQQRDPQAVFPSLALHAGLLFDAGRLDEARTVAVEVVERRRSARLSSGFHGFVVYAFVRLVGREATESVLEGLPETKWRHISSAVLESNLVRAAELAAAYDFPAEAAALRLRAGRELAAAGAHQAADVQLRDALAFYRSVEATRCVREAEELLSAIA